VTHAGGVARLDRYRSCVEISVILPEVHIILYATHIRLNVLVVPELVVLYHSFCLLLSKAEVKLSTLQKKPRKKKD
jgi:hypothetical protein